MKKVLLPVAILFLFTGAMAQDIPYARHLVDTLASPSFLGRGYTKDGMEKAAQFLAAQFREVGLQPMKGESYFQKFTYPVNTFPGKMEVSINGKKLIPGEDYIISAESKSVKSYGELEQRDSVTFFDRENRVFFVLKDKLTWECAPAVEEYTLILLDKKRVTKKPQGYSINVENSFVKKFNAVNICATVKGTAVPDSFIVFTGHYDHLGGMGAETYFPGANDNASGVALCMNLAKYYAKNPSRYSIAFILFAGEEPGLIGSKYFTEHPLIDMKKIRFLLNNDIAGTGEDGITIVNSTVFVEEFNAMRRINDSKGYLKTLAQRGKAAISDHYFFTEAGVPSFFFFTMGGIQAYHDVYDKAETLPLNKHEELLKLLVEFTSALTD